MVRQNRRGKSGLEKTKMCRAYENGQKCWKGSECTYAHGKDELVTQKPVPTYAILQRPKNATQWSDMARPHPPSSPPPPPPPPPPLPPSPPPMLDAPTHRLWVSKDAAIAAVEAAIADGKTEIHISVVGNWCDEV